MATAGQSLRDKQVAALKELLNFNKPVKGEEDGHSEAAHAQGEGASSEEPLWKVLVFDDLGRDVISAVLRVSDLRSIGITLHMHLAQPRHPIEDCPAVYFVEPTLTNLNTIAQDLKTDLYSQAYINFTSSVPRPLLEEFASEAATAGVSDRIAQLFDQYLNFVVAEPDLFSLNMQKDHTYYALNSPRTTEEQLASLTDKIISGMFSVVATLGVVPIIRCSIGGAAEMISTKLDRKLRDHVLNSKTNIFSNSRQTATGTAASRPVLIVLDRNIDLTPMLSHSWTYLSLINDVLSMKLNRITVETPVDENNPAKGTTKKAYDLTSNDFFWAKNSGLPFPAVAEDIDAELTKYKADAAEITKKTGASSIEDLQDLGTSASAQHLKAAITLLPELRERKACLDMHMTVLAAILTGIKNRHLDDYFQLEENAARQTKTQILEIIKDDSKRGSEPQDMLRLFLVFALSTDQDITRAEWTQFEEALKGAGIDTTSLPFIRQLRATTKMTQLTTVNSAPQQSSASSDLFGRFSSISTRLADRLKETGVSSNLSANLDSLIGGIKAFLPENKDYTITKIVESIMDPSTASSSAIARTENFLYFDPRHAHARGSMPPPVTIRPASTAPGGLPGPGLGGQGPGTGATFGQRRQGFSEALVFVVGGGSMLEYGNLQDWAMRTGGERAKRRVIYGSEFLVSAKEFIQDELERLGREVS